MTDFFDILVKRTSELSAARFEAAAYRAWFRGSLDKLHEQHREIESCRRQLAALREENRRLRSLAEVAA